MTQRPTWRQKHFEGLAYLIRTSHLNQEDKKKLAEYFAGQLRKTNPMFETEWFLDDVLKTGE